MNHRKLLEFFDARRDRGQALVLATVYDTAGSTYSKAGAQMLVESDGIFQGMLSGGCLEGDLALRAQQVLETGEPQRVTYDLSMDNDDLWGLGVGCDGLMRVLLQALDAADDYAPFAAVAALQRGLRPGIVATVIESPASASLAGATLVTDGDMLSVHGIEGEAAESLAAAAQEALAGGRSELRRLDLGGAAADVLFAVTRTVPRLLVMGAGLDAAPVVRFGNELGWQCTVVDHRPGYLERGDLGDAARTVCVRAETVADEVDLDAFDAAVVMSHHLASDERYLAALAASDVAYIGLLGPPARRQRIVESLGDDAAGLGGRLHGPAGLDLGGRGPAAIALSIIAEVHAHLEGRA